MKSTLTDVETEALLDDAESEFPTSEFVASVREWFEEHGFITAASSTCETTAKHAKKRQARAPANRSDLWPVTGSR